MVKLATGYTEKADGSTHRGRSFLEPPYMHVEELQLMSPALLLLINHFHSHVYVYDCFRLVGVWSMT